ncbi:YrhB domain-containing protein [Streptomyces sp. NPDC059578]|uniref:YrhB domain-containing protein n=1 Tax=Streptomyces sp. NPDC059578 TaxID=3346874 RepID=UPI0036AC08C3
MLTKEEAVRAARHYLDGLYAHGSDGWTIVVLPEESYAYVAGWVVRYDSQEALDSGQPWMGPMTKLVIVPGDGSEPYQPPTSTTAEQFDAFLKSGTWPGGAR